MQECRALLRACLVHGPTALAALSVARMNPSRRWRRRLNLSLGVPFDQVPHPGFELVLLIEEQRGLGSSAPQPGRQPAVWQQAPQGFCHTWTS